jgi:D-3-phosphoglycerate dehydrogenase
MPSKMKVVVTDYTFPSLDVEEAILREYDAQLVGAQCKTPEALIALVHDADAVITQFAPVNADVVASMQRARVIVRYGIGVDNVDLVAARQRQIPVCNVPDYCIDEVADHTLALILAATRSVVPNHLKVRDGAWGLAVPLEQMRCLRDLTVGIVGFGRIGREVAGRLGPFKCRRLVFDPAVAADLIRSTGCEPVSFESLLSQSDVVTLHCPSNERTRGMMNHTTIGSMKRQSILVNVGRGDLVDSAALLEALGAGHLSAVALDVFQPEPIPSDHPILQMGNVVVGSHIASASVPAASKLRRTAAQIAAMALQGKSLPNVVNA